MLSPCLPSPLLLLLQSCVAWSVFGLGAAAAVAAFRCLGPFLVETCALVEAGVGLEKLDKIMKSYGLPVGPITLADEVCVCACVCFLASPRSVDRSVAAAATAGGVAESSYAEDRRPNVLGEKKGEGMVSGRVTDG